jgi:hypothetical protein
MSDDERSANQSGGVNIGSGNVTVGGDIVGHDKDKIVDSQISDVQLNNIFRPLMGALKSAPPEVQEKAIHKVTALKDEVVKGKSASDGVIAKLLEGLIALVPGAVTAVVSAFGTPILAGVAGPATKYVLDKIRPEPGALVR